MDSDAFVNFYKGFDLWLNNCNFNVNILNCSFVENPLGGATIHNSQIEYHIESKSTDLVGKQLFFYSSSFLHLKGPFTFLGNLRVNLIAY